MSLFIFVVLIIFRLGWTLWQKWTTLANWPLNAVRTTSPWTAASLLMNWVTTAPLTIQKVEGHAPFIPSWSKTFQNCFRVWISSTSRPLDKTKYHLHLQKSLLPPPRNLKRQSVTPPKKKEHQIQQCREIAGLAFPNALFKVALRVTSLLHSLCLKSPCTWRVMGTQGALGLRLSSTRLIWAEAHPPFWIHRIARSSGWSWNQSIQAMGVSPMRVSMPWMGGTCRWVSRDHRKSLWRDAHQRPCRFHTQKHLTNFKTMHSKAKQAYSDSSSPPPSSGEDISDPDQREMSSSPNDQAPATGSLWILNQNALCISNTSGSPKEHWYGSDEFLALPAQLKKTEMLAMKLESLAQALPQRGLQESIQDVDDWELTEVNPDWESSNDLLLLHPYKKPSRAGRFSPTSSSDVAPSLDDSIESGPLSDLLSEDEGARSTPESRGRNISGRPSAPKMMFQCTPLIQQLLADIQHQENYHDVWAKLEVRDFCFLELA